MRASPLTLSSQPPRHYCVVVWGGNEDCLFLPKDSREPVIAPSHHLQPSLSLIMHILGEKREDARGLRFDHQAITADVTSAPLHHYAKSSSKSKSNGEDIIACCQTGREFRGGELRVVSGEAPMEPMIHRQQAV